MKNHSPCKRFFCAILVVVLTLTTFTGFTYYPRLNDQIDASPNMPSSSGTAPAPSTSTSSGTAPVGSMLPLFDIAIKSGKPFSFQCVAPAGATVTATFNGKTYALSYKGSAAASSYVTHSGSISMPSVTGTKEFGVVTYNVTYQNKSYKKQSVGRLFGVGADATLKVQIKNNSATIFNAAVAQKTSGYRTVAHRGAIDTVVAYGNNGNMYQLGSGGWINANNCTPLTTNYAVNNPISSVKVGSERSRVETYAFVGAAHPMYTSSHTANSLTITLARTTGVSKPDISGSNIFSDVSVSESNGHTTITFTNKYANALWGYAVEYNSGTTTIVCTRKPTLSEGSQPLAGVRIALDPGHGGNDNGTRGVAPANGWVEKNANLATARALRDRLEAAGATVIMTREGDTRVEMTDRLNHAQRERADFYISMHCNYSSNSKTTGVEIYYHNTFSATFASTMMNAFTQATGRKNFRTEQSHYVVTLGAFAPSILVEMGFMSNTGEYNDLISQSGINNAVEGLYNGIVNTLR